MRYWRMAMREGPRGMNRFPECFDRRIAALGWEHRGGDIVGDCRELTPDEYNDKWSRSWRQATSPRRSLWYVWREMKKGDIIYAKCGTMVVGKGTIIRGYAFDPRIGEATHLGSHFVRVAWDTHFTGFPFGFHAPIHTVLPLTGDELKHLRRAERHADVNMATTAIRLPRSAPSDDLTASEGQPRRLLIKHRVREGRLRRAKIRQSLSTNAGRLRCQVPGCGFDFRRVYGDLGREYAHVHHCQPLATGKHETTLDDLKIVCANCHAMIHRHGGCRDMRGLIHRH